MKRIFPAGLLSFLTSAEVAPSNEFELLLVREDNLKTAQEQSSRPKGLINTKEVERYVGVVRVLFYVEILLQKWQNVPLFLGAFLETTPLGTLS